MKALLCVVCLLLLAASAGCMFDRDPMTGSRNPITNRRIKKQRGMTHFSSKSNDRDQGDVISLPRWGE